MDRQQAEATAREGYDQMADIYANHVAAETTVPSLAVAGLEQFAHLVQAGDGGAVADVGCGPGHITRFLADLGLDVFGVDISTALLKIARDANPDLRFEQGELGQLPIEPSSLRAIVSKHSVIHTPAELVPRVLDEFARVLEPGGLLFLSFFGSDEPGNHGNAFDHVVTTAYQLDVDAMAGLLEGAGFVEKVRLVSQPREHERQLPYVMFYAQRP